MKKLNILAASMLLPFAANADWTIANDFNETTDFDSVNAFSNLEEDGTMNPGETGAMALLEDGMLKCVHGDRFTSNSNLFVTVPFGTDIVAESATADDVVTVYFELYLPEVTSDTGSHVADIDAAFGPINVDGTSYDAIKTSSYNSFNALGRVENDNTFDLYDYVPSSEKNTYLTTDVELMGDTTYSVWAVIDFWNESVQYYVATGDDNGTKTLVNIPDSEDNGFVLRTAPGDSTSEYFMLALSAGNTGTKPADKGDDYFYIDNLSYSAGELLTDPTGATTVMGGTSTWGDTSYVLEDNGNVDTGDLMGWIYVSGDFVYSYSLASWLYLPSSLVTEAGTWAWIYN